MTGVVDPTANEVVDDIVVKCHTASEC